MSFEEIYRSANDPGSFEVGGGHNQKGINFQRAWAVARMFELESEGKDFLLLFEAIQDLAEFDSELNPKSVWIYQVKKRDSSNWSWRDLTNLLDLNKKRALTQDLSEIKSSPIGRLYASVRTFRQIDSKGAFVSNVGCELPLAHGGTMATSISTALSSVSATHGARLKDALSLFHEAGDSAVDLNRLWVRKIYIHPDAPENVLIGIAHSFLKSRSPHHANQAESLIDTLLAKIGPLGAKTDRCNSYEDLRRERGYSREDFRKALGALEQVPDVASIVKTWIEHFPLDSDFTYIDQARTRIEVSRIFHERLLGRDGSTDQALVSWIDTWLNEHPVSNQILDDLKKASKAVSGQFPDLRRERIFAQILLRAARSCADPT